MKELLVEVLVALAGAVFIAAILGVVIVFWCEVVVQSWRETWGAK